MEKPQKTKRIFYSLRDKHTKKYYVCMQSASFYMEGPFCIRYELQFRKQPIFFSLPMLKAELKRLVAHKMSLDNLEICKFSEITELKKEKSNLIMGELIKNAEREVIFKKLKG